MSWQARWRCPLSLPKGRACWVSWVSWVCVFCVCFACVFCVCVCIPGSVGLQTPGDGEGIGRTCERETVGFGQVGFPGRAAWASRVAQRCIALAKQVPLPTAHTNKSTITDYPRPPATRTRPGPGSFLTCPRCRIPRRRPEIPALRCGSCACCHRFPG